MPDAGMLWRHVVINTFGTWLHGDGRGFRSRMHRIHSSGDYRHRPREGEHGGLHTHHDRVSGDEVTIERGLRKVIGQTLLSSLFDRHYRVLTIAVGKVHSHALVELPEPLSTVKAIIGEAKRASSRAVKTQLPGSIWAAGGTFLIVKNDPHLRKANDYILYDQGPGAWTWSFRDRSWEGQFARKRAPRSGRREYALPRRVCK
jgi:REP element-mobilizing transposase RayT